MRTNHNDFLRSAWCKSHDVARRAFFPNHMRHEADVGKARRASGGDLLFECYKKLRIYRNHWQWHLALR